MGIGADEPWLLIPLLTLLLLLLLLLIIAVVLGATMAIDVVDEFVWGRAIAVLFVAVMEQVNPGAQDGQPLTAGAGAGVGCCGDGDCGGGGAGDDGCCCGGGSVSPPAVIVV